MPVKQVTFYQSGLESIVWNPETDSALAEFERGYFTTSDKKVIEKLKDIGYQIMDSQEDTDPETNDAKPRVSRLRA